MSFVENWPYCLRHDIAQLGIPVLRVTGGGEVGRTAGFARNSLVDILYKSYHQNRVT